MARTIDSHARLLVAGPDRDLVDLLVVAFRSAAFDPHPAYDAASALALQERHRPHLAVVDLDLVDCVLLSRSCARSLVPIVALVRPDPGGRTPDIAALQLTDYLMKPFSHHALVAAVHRALRPPALRRQGGTISRHITADTGMGAEDCPIAP